jgi:chromosome segregation ATPase
LWIYQASFRHEIHKADGRGWQKNERVWHTNGTRRDTLPEHRLTKEELAAARRDLALLSEQVDAARAATEAMAKERDEAIRQAETAEFAALADLHDQLRHERLARTRLEKERDEAKRALCDTSDRLADIALQRDEFRRQAEILNASLAKAHQEKQRALNDAGVWASRAEEARTLARRIYHEPGIVFVEWQALPKQFPWLEDRA